MSISQAKRTELHQELREKLTVDTADTLMEHLPPGGWGEVATKSDIESLRVATKSDIESLRVATKTDIELLRVATQRDIAELKAATQADIAKLSAETQAEFALVRKDLQLLEARLIEKLNKTIIKQNRWMIGILGSLVVAMIIALVR
jgi:hypothetical protein